MAQEKGLGGVWKGDKSEEVLDNMMREMLQLPIGAPVRFKYT